RCDAVGEALGVDPGDAVCVSDAGCAGSHQSIEHCGADCRPTAPPDSPERRAIGERRWLHRPRTTGPCRRRAAPYPHPHLSPIPIGRSEVRAMALTLQVEILKSTRATPRFLDTILRAPGDATWPIKP